MRGCGQPSRQALLRRFIEFMQGYDGVWFATGTEVTEACEKQKVAAQEREKKNVG